MLKSVTQAFLLLGAAALWPASVQAAGECDLTTAGSSCTINGAVYAQGETQPAGSDQIAFVRIGANETEVQGYNTSGRPVEFDELTDLTHTHDLLTSQLVQVDGSYLFLLDINQTQSSSGRLLSLDQVQIFGSNTGGLTSYATLGTKVYDMDEGGDSWIKLSNNVSGGPSSGSGDFDMTLSLPVSLLDGFSHVYLFSQFGSHFANNDGYEEWVAVVPEPSVAWLLALGLLVVVLRRAPLRFASNGFWRIGGGDLTAAA